jgi:hypothetical protein
VVRLFIMPQAGTGTDADPVRPKYAAQLGSLTWWQLDPQPGRVAIVAIDGLTPAQAATLDGLADVVQVPVRAIVELFRQLLARGQAGA